MRIQKLEHNIMGLNEIALLKRQLDSQSLNVTSSSCHLLIDVDEAANKRRSLRATSVG